MHGFFSVLCTWNVVQHSRQTSPPLLSIHRSSSFIFKLFDFCHGGVWPGHRSLSLSWTLLGGSVSHGCVTVMIQRLTRAHGWALWEEILFNFLGIYYSNQTTWLSALGKTGSFPWPSVLFWFMFMWWVWTLVLSLTRNYTIMSHLFRFASIHLLHLIR